MNEFSFAPNSANEFLYISLPESDNPLDKISILGRDSQVILEVEDLTKAVDISSLDTGIYFLCVEYQNRDFVVESFVKI